MVLFRATGTYGEGGLVSTSFCQIRYPYSNEGVDYAHWIKLSTPHQNVWPSYAPVCLGGVLWSEDYEKWKRFQRIRLHKIKSLGTLIAILSKTIEGASRFFGKRRYLLWLHQLLSLKLRIEKTWYLNLKSGLEGVGCLIGPRSYQNFDQTEKGMANLLSFFKDLLIQMVYHDSHNLDLKLHKCMIDLVQPFFRILFTLRASLVK